MSFDDDAYGALAFADGRVVRVNGVTANQTIRVLETV